MFEFSGSQWTQEELAAIRMMERAALLEFKPHHKGPSMATGDRIRLKSLITMADDEFNNLVADAGKHPHGAAMATILKLAKERRIMSPPRRPKGEKPRITIRYLQRQIANLQGQMLNLNGMCADREKQIARQDVELSEAADRERILESETASYADRYGTLLGVHQNKMLRLQFLEGYYHAKRETFSGSGPGYQGSYPDGAAARQEGGTEDIAQRDGRSTGGETQRFQAHNRAPDNGRSVAREATTDFQVSEAADGIGWTRR